MAPGKDSPSQLRTEVQRAGNAASEHANKGTEAAKESAAHYKGAAEEGGLSVLKGAQDRFQSAKDYTAEKTDQAVDTAAAAKDQAVDSATQAKDSTVGTLSEYSQEAKGKLGDLKEGAQQKYEHTKQSATETAQNLKDSTQDKYNQAADSAERAEDVAANKYGATKDNTYEYIEDAKQKLENATESMKRSSAETTNSATRETGKKVEGGKEIISEYVGPATEKTAESWDATKQKASELTGVAQEETGNAKNTVASTWDATQEKAAETTGAAQNKYHSAWESGKKKTQETSDTLRDKASESTETVHEHSLLSFDGLKQRALELLGGAQNTSDTASGVKDSAPSTWDATKRKTSQTADYLGGKSNRAGLGELEGGEKQKASQLLGSAQNETADTFGDTQDRSTLSQSTGGHTHPKAGKSVSTWDATKDKSHVLDHHGSGANWDGLKQRASQFLGSAQNETADTLNDTQDRTTLSESTAGANWDKAPHAQSTWDATKDKTQAEAYHKPGVGVTWDGLKQKASQILESFGNETADTFDTVQDRNSISESIAGADQNKAGEAALPFDHTNVKASVHNKASESLDQIMADTSKSADFQDHEADHSIGLTWGGLKQKASEVLSNIQQSVDSAERKAEESSNETGGEWHDVMKKYAEAPAVAYDNESTSSNPALTSDMNVFSSETRRATAGQVADYAEH